MDEGSRRTFLYAICRSIESDHPEASVKKFGYLASTTGLERGTLEVKALTITVARVLTRRTRLGALSVSLILFLTMSTSTKPRRLDKTYHTHHNSLFLVPPCLSYLSLTLSSPELLAPQPGGRPSRSTPAFM